MRKPVVQAMVCGVVMLMSVVVPVAAKTTIRFFFWGNADEINQRKKMVGMFNAGNPDITVKAEWCDPSVYDSKLVSMIAAGISPDVINMCNDWHGKRNRLFANLNTYLKQDKEIMRGDFYPVALTSLAEGPNQYALPYLVKSPGIFVNTQLLRQAGVPMPTDSWNWDDFVVVAQKTTAAGKTGTFGLCGINYLESAFGGRIFNADYTRTNANNDLVAMGLQLRYDLINKYQVMPNMSYIDFNPFTLGKAAMTQAWTWDVLGFQRSIRKRFDWDIVGFPWDSGRKRYVGVNVDGIAMARNGKHKAEAYRFMRYLSFNREIQAMIAKTEGVPTLKSIAASDSFLKEFPNGQPYRRQVFAGTAEQGDLPQFGGYFQPVGDVWSREISAFLNRKQGLREALKRFDDQANTILKSGRLR